MTGVLGLQFRYRGQRYHRSLGTTNEVEAKQVKHMVERTLRYLDEGVISLPDDANADDLWQFLRSNGKVVRRTDLRQSLRLDLVCGEFLDSIKHLEDNSVDTIKKHLNHFRRILGSHVPLDKVSPANLRYYVAQREAAPGIRGGTIKGDTIRKELQTFKQLWEFAAAEGFVTGTNPCSLISLPKKAEKPPFMTWEEVEQQISLGGLTVEQEAELWDCLFLREEEIAAFLAHVKPAAEERRFPFIYPAICFCAYTGCRRSEMFRSLQADVGINGKIRLREKKRDKERSLTYRYVPLHPELRPILENYFTGHPGGQHTFVKANGKPLEDRSARDAWEAVTAGSQWTKLRGFHIFRHSFASNLARHGVDDRKIRALMGHETEEMSRRYRHLFPEDQEAALAKLSFSPILAQKRYTNGTPNGLENEKTS